MDRCKICDWVYEMKSTARFPDEHYCPYCEAEIVICLMEMEEWEETEEEMEDVDL